jgi:hypothetical protein
MGNCRQAEGESTRNVELAAVVMLSSEIREDELVPGSNIQILPRSSSQSYFVEQGSTTAARLPLETLFLIGYDPISLISSSKSCILVGTLLSF